MATNEAPPPRYTPIQETPRMEGFDHIEELRRPNPLPSRQRREQVSPLQAYQVDEYQPPPTPKPPKPAGYIHPGLRVMWVIWIICLGIWLAFAIRYKFNLFPINSILNPIRNPASYNVFVYVLGITAFISLLLIPWILLPNMPNLLFVSFIVLISYLTLAVLIIFIINYNRPYSCENMPSKFPVYVTLQAGKTGNAKVYVNGHVYWHMKHEKVDRQTHTWISAEYLIWDKNLTKYVKQEIDWPHETAVNSIWTSLTPNAGAHGNVTGTCKGVPCLEGKIWTHPNLEFEWVYTNPVTGEKKTTRLASDEGRWFYGKKSRPLVTLHKDGSEVFRAQSTRTVCTAGDGELETSLVPVGLMFIAENNFMNIK